MDYTKTWLDRQLAIYQAEGYGETERALAKREERFAKALAYLRSSDRVLDLGCNDGSFTAILAQTCREATGVDFPEVIEMAKKKFPQLKFIATDDLTKMDFEDESFNAIVALGLIEHIADDFSFLSKCQRWLTHHGVLIMSTPLSPDKICEEKSPHLRFYPPYSLMRIMLMLGYGVRDILIFKDVDEYLIVGVKVDERDIPTNSS